jgi:hypothetical protein
MVSNKITPLDSHDYDMVSNATHSVWFISNIPNLTYNKLYNPNK